MKHLLNQIMSAAGALLCVLAFWVAAALKTSDAAALCVLIAVPAALGCFLGCRTGLHGLTLPLYSTPMMLALAYGRVYPYYSTDVGSLLPCMLYTIFLAPSAILPVLTIVVVRAVRRRKHGPNQSVDAYGSPAADGG